jgi:hypothetical protein
MPSAEPSHDLATVNAVSGKDVRVLDKAGNEIKGRVVSATGTELVLKVSKSQRTIAVRDIARIARNGDSVWDGAAIAVAIGLGASAVPQDAGDPCTGHCFRNSAGGEVVGLAILAGFGAWIDSKHSHREVIYQAP